jgi:hypothetical protein
MRQLMTNAKIQSLLLYEACVGRQTRSRGVKIISVVFISSASEENSRIGSRSGFRRREARLHKELDRAGEFLADLERTKVKAYEDSRHSSPIWSYSSRSMLARSARVARIAGAELASPATARKRIGTISNVAGSIGDTP